MGAAQSSDGREPYFGVLVEPELLEQLAGKTRKPSRPQPAAGTAALLPGRGAFMSDRDAAMKLAVTDSVRRGNMLLKYEEGEADRIHAQASDLIKQHYSGPEPKPVPCSSERAECIECYKTHAQDPLKCAAQVAAFSECANGAWRAKLAAA